MEPRAGPANAAAAEARLRDLLPPALLEVFNASFIRSNLLFDEFVFRLVLQVLRQTGIDTALQVPAGTEEIAARARVDRARGLAPLDWMLRHLAGRLWQRRGHGRPDGFQRYALRDDRPRGDAVRLAQKPQHEMFGADLVVAGSPGFVLRRHHDVLRPRGEPAEPLLGIEV